MKSRTRITSIILILFCSLVCTLSSAAQVNKKDEKLMKKNVETNQKQQSNSGDEEIKKIVAELDTKYQQAVKMNDAATMDCILSDDFIIVTGKGKVFTKADLLKEARDGKTIYERQEDSEQTVRVWGDTAIITALLWAKGTEDGKPFEYKLWFSDVYKRTPNGWCYVFAQSSIPLPNPQ